MDIIEREVVRLAKDLADKLELRIIRNLGPESWPRYLTPFPMGSEPVFLRKPRLNPLGNKTRKQVRAMKRAMKFLRTSMSDEITRDFGEKWSFHSFRKMAWQT
jgi:hypothetical protein